MIVNLAVPVIAEELAVSVRLLVEVVGFVLNDAVTPLGRPDAVSVTLSVNPPTSITVIVLVPPVAPWVTVTLLGEAKSMKLGDDEPVKPATSRG